MLGIAGAGMRSLAALLSKRQVKIYGADQVITLADRAGLPADYTVVPEDSALPLLSHADRLIYSDSIPATHPLRQAAAQHHIPQQMLFEALGELSQNSITLAVTGTHGKSSTTAMLAHILRDEGHNVSLFLGAGAESSPKGQPTSGGEAEYFVIEADEYRRHFLHLHPSHAIITTIDHDHPDYFTSPADVEAAFAAFIRKLPPNGWLVTTPTVHAAHPELPWPAHTLVVPPPDQPITLTLPGQHMQHNAALAIALAGKLGVSDAAARRSLTTFPGLSRRFETVGKLGSLQLISDYGHHPAEIAATLQAARELYPDRKLLAIIEPHTTARVDAFLNEFVKVLAAALIDGVIIFRTFFVKGREDEGTAIASSSKLFKALHARRSTTWYAKNQAELDDILHQQASHFDTAIAFTAGILDQHLRQLGRL